MSVYIGWQKGPDICMSTVASITVFISYAQEDEAYCLNLGKHLQAMQRQQLVQVWHRRNISAGTDWTQQIDKYLDTADVILLLISSDFLASDYCYSIEMQRAMKRHETRKARVVPIILRHVDWRDVPFARLPALPTGGKPVTEWSTPDQAFLDVVEGVKRIVRELLALSQARSHMSTGRYEEALKAYNEVLKSNDYSASAHAGRGHALSRLKLYNDALLAYEQALAQDPTTADIYMGKASALLHLNQYEETLQEALSAFSQAISLAPNLATAHSGKGDVLFQLRRYGEALKAYEEALRLSPNEARVYVSKGQALNRLAQQAFEQASQLGYNEEKQMEPTDRSRTQMQSLPIDLEKLILLRTIPISNPHSRDKPDRAGDLPSSLTAIAASPDGKFLAGAYTSLHSEEDLPAELVAELAWHRSELGPPPYHPPYNQQHIFSATLWDLKTEKVVKTIGELRQVSCLCFSSDGQTLLHSGRDERNFPVVQAWDVKTGELTQTFPISIPMDYGVISANEQIFVGRYCPTNRTDEGWIPAAFKLSTGKELYRLDNVTPYQQMWDNVMWAVSSDGKTLVGGSHVRVGTSRRKMANPEIANKLNLDVMTLSLWDIPTGKLLHTISDLPFSITALAISPDRQIFASGYENGTIKIWKLSTMQLLSAFVAHQSTVSALTFSWDGHRVISASNDGTIKIWGNS